MNYVHVLAQTTWPLVFDKALTADPLVLLAIAIVIVVLTSLVTTYLNGRRSTRDDDLKELIVKVFTDENSPLVKSNKDVAASNRQVALAVKLSTKRTRQQTTILSTKTEEQTTEIKGLRASTEGFQGMVTRDLSKQTESIATLSSSVNSLNTTVVNGVNEIRVMLQQHIATSADCSGIDAKLSLFQATVLQEIRTYLQKSTQERLAIDLANPIAPPNTQMTVPPAATLPEKMGTNN